MWYECVSTSKFLNKPWLYTSLYSDQYCSDQHVSNNNNNQKKGKSAKWKSQCKKSMYWDQSDVWRIRIGQEDIEFPL